MNNFDKKAIRRFELLDTNEVSLVDTPANEQEFLVMKNKNQESNMADKKNNEGVVVSVEDTENNENNDVAKAMEHVNSIVENIAKMTLKTKEGEDQEVDEIKENVEKQNDQENESENESECDVEKSSIKSVLSSAGLEKEMLEKVCASFKKLGLDPNASFPSAKPPVKKSADEDTDDNCVSEDQPMTMQGFVDAVSKAAAFTPSRIQQLKQAQEILKLMLESVAPNMSPATNVPGMMQHSNPSGTSKLSSPKKMPKISKSENNEIVEAIKSFEGEIKKINERVEAIEKARNPSNSVDDEGVTDSKVEKSNDLWEGAL